MAETIVVSDQRIAQIIRQELGWNQRGGQSRIEVEVDNGFATLTGVVSNYVRKMEAEKAVRQVAGIE